MIREIEPNLNFDNEGPDPMKKPKIILSDTIILEIVVDTINTI